MMFFNLELTCWAFSIVKAILFHSESTEYVTCSVYLFLVPVLIFHMWISDLVHKARINMLQTVIDTVVWILWKV